MIPIGLQYSNDNGSTWSTALTINCWNLRVTEVHDPDNGENSITGLRYPRKFSYLYVVLTPDMDHFDPSDATHGATANTNWATLEAITGAKLIRLYNNDTTTYPNWDGHTEFNVSNNTNYLLLESNTPRFENMDKSGASGRKRRTMTLELQSRSAI